MRAVKISELPTYVLARLGGKLPTCVRPTSTNPADEDAHGCLPMCGQRAAYVALTTPGDVTGVTWCADCVARDMTGWRGAWHPLAVDEVETFVDEIARPAADAPEITRDVDPAAEIATLTTERDTARRQRDQLTDQLDAALDDRDRARADMVAARAELRTEIETHRVTCDRLADVDHHADGLRMALALILDGPTTDPGSAALGLIGRLGPGGRWTGAALAAHSAGHYGKAIRLAARGILHRHDDGDQGETLGDVAAEILDDSTAPATLSTGSEAARV